MLIRDLIAQEGFDRARRNGDKYDDAISEAISTVHEWFHEMPISKTEVKRVLAKRRSSELEETMLATNDVAEVSEASPPQEPTPASVPSEATGPLRIIKPIAKRLSLRFGPSPKHPRHNAETDKLQ